MPHAANAGLWRTKADCVLAECSWGGHVLLLCLLTPRVPPQAYNLPFEQQQTASPHPPSLRS